MTLRLTEDNYDHSLVMLGYVNAGMVVVLHVSFWPIPTQIDFASDRLYRTLTIPKRTQKCDFSSLWIAVHKPECHQEYRYSVLLREYAFADLHS